MQTIEQALNKLQQSTFRRKFHLTSKDKQYITKRGMVNIQKDAELFVENRLADAYPKNDGKQTPFRGHPIFVAQHATACCCRKCLEKWYKVPQGVELSAERQEKIVSLLMAWIEKEMK
jgi:hypothetical protein